MQTDPAITSPGGRHRARGRKHDPMPRRNHRQNAGLREIAFSPNWKYAASLAGCALLAALSVLATASMVSAAQAIYRCDHEGRVTYTDSPCERPAPPPGSAAPAPKTATAEAVVGGGDANPFGPWRGQAQFKVTQAGPRSENAHLVTPLVVELGDDGKVTGGSEENGCNLSGSASSGPTPTTLRLDVTVSNCPANDLNRRYHGSLHIDPASRLAQLRLQALKIDGGQSTVADVEATMRR
jgi:hypothetical protein